MQSATRRDFLKAGITGVAATGLGTLAEVLAQVPGLPKGKSRREV